MTESEKSEYQVKVAWDLFKRFSNEELDNLLNVAGVKPMKDRAFKLHQVLLVWFHGYIPNLSILTKLTQESLF